MSEIKVFSQAPHFDDFDEKNNYQRILFRPSIPVQTRELNQLQTILQNQIANSASFSFGNGARIINGEASLINKLPYITLDSLIKGDATSYLGARVTLEVGGVEKLAANVVAVARANGDDPETLYITYEGANEDNGEIVFATGAEVKITFTDVTLNPEMSTVTGSGNGVGYSVNEGIYFFKGNFVYVPKQTAVVNKYSNEPSAEEVSVGFAVYETVVTAEEDEALFDNAIGSPNESAPGAYRYKMQAYLVRKSDILAGENGGFVTSDAQAIPTPALDVRNYYELAVIKFGQVQIKPREDNQASVLEQTLARRTFDESGDYVVDDFILSLREHLNTGVSKSGTYSQSGVTITVTIASHGLTIGDEVQHTFTTGNSISDTYKIASTPSIDTYTIIARDSQTTSGNVSVSYGGNRGVYTVADGGTESKLVAVLDKGKAYVRGFEIETLGNTFIDIEKSRTTKIEQNTVTQLQYGTAFFVYSANATQDLANPVIFTQVSLKGAGAVERGTAFVRGFRYDSVRSISAVNKTVYRLDLIGVQFNAGFSFSDILTITSTGTFPLAATVVPAPGVGYVSLPNESTTVYQLPYGLTKSMIPQIYTRLYEKTVTSTSASAQPTLVTFATETAGETFDDEVTSFTVYAAGSPAVSGLPLSVSLTNAGKTATLDITNLVGQNQGGRTVTVIAKTFKNDAIERSKTLTTAPVYTVAAASRIVLPNTDIFEVLSIFSGNLNVTDFYQLDNGQRDTIYDFGALVLKNGYTVPSGNVSITYTYFAHGAGDFFSGDSYTNVSYGDIPEYIDTQGKRLFLGSCVDFRTSRLTATTIEKPGATAFFGNDPFFSTVEFYLSRKDKIVLNKRGQFQVIQGVPAIEPELPMEPVDSISLYNLHIPAYTFVMNDVSISQLRHQRFTMKDISKIVTRLENVEQATSLSLLETKINSKQELNKFRNGFVVDNFQTQTVGMIEDPYHFIGHDMTKGEIRPTNITYNVDIERNNSSDLRVHSDGMITLQYSEVPFAKQELASTIIRLQPYALSDFLGQLSINPSSDNWFDTRTVNTFLDRVGTFAQRYSFSSGTAYPRYLIGTTWDFVNGVWTNVKTGKNATAQEKKDIQAAIKRAPDYVTGTKTTVETTLESSVDSTSAIPFIRSRLVNFSAVGLKPFSRVYLKFDGIDISAYAGHTEGTIGQQLTVGGGGTIAGVFRIPNDKALRFMTGRRKVVVSDKPGNTNSFDDTVCDTFYEAAGTLITTTNTFVNTRSSVTSSRVYDPVAQSFYVKDDAFLEGVFVSSIDVYFGPGISPTTNTESVRLELRNMVNGYPGVEIPHNGRVTVPASQIFGSTDASVATRFTFPSPVFLEDGNEYCFVLVSKSETINVWASKLGQKNVVAGEKTPNSGQEISKQPYLGSLFLSQNDTTWTPEQTMDLKFVINRCKFGSSGSMTLINKIPASEVGTDFDIHATNLESNPFAFVNGSTTMRVFDWGHGFKVGDRVKITNPKVTVANVSSISYNGVPATAIYTVGANNPSGLLISAVDSPITSTVAYSQTTTNIVISLANAPFQVGDVVTLDFLTGAALDGDFTVSAVTATNFTVTSTVSQTTSGNVVVTTDDGFGTYTVTIANAATATGRNGNTGNVVNRVIDYSTIRLLADVAVINGSNVSYKYRSQDYASGNLSSFIDITPNTELNLSTRQKIPASADSSLTLQALLTSPKDTISPIFDASRVSFVVQKNLINNTADKFNGRTFGAVARYVQRPMSVITPSNQLDVFVDLNLPSGSSVKVYYRVGQTEVSGIWREMSLAVGETLVNSDDPKFFKETKFSTEGTTLGNFFVSQVKIVFLSPDSTKAPRLKNYRSISVNKI